MSQQSHVRVKKSGVKKRRQIIGQKRNIPADEYMAASIGDVEWLDISLSDGRSPISMDRNGLTPIHLAALHGHLPCIRLLVEKYNVDVNVRSMTGWSALHLAINKENGSKVQKCIHYLMDQGADINGTNDDNTTPLHQAASEGLLDCIKLLLRCGADVNVEDIRGHSARDLAKLWSQKKCARVIQTEMWKAQKEAQAKNLKILNNAKEKYIGLQDEALHQLHNEKEFYGGVAFGNWLDDKGISPPPPIDMTRERYPDSTVSGLERRLRSHGGMVDCSTRIENSSARRQTREVTKKKTEKTKATSEKAVKTSKVKAAATQQQVQVVNHENEEVRLPPTLQDLPMGNLIDWNPSTNLESEPVTDIKNKAIVGISVHPDSIKSIIPDSANLAVQLDLKKKPKIKVVLPGGRIRTADINVPRLSKATIYNVMTDQKGRIMIPQEFKAIHISDVDKKRHTTSGYPSEIGMHLSIYGNTGLSKKKLASASTADFERENRERMLRTLENMTSKPTFLA